MKTVVIGCGIAGIIAASTIKKIKPETEVIIGKEKGIFIRCSAPYVLSCVTNLKKCIKP